MGKSHSFFSFQIYVAKKYGTKIVEGMVGYVHMLSFVLEVHLLANCVCMCTCHVSFFLENYVVHLYIDA